MASADGVARICMSDLEHVSQIGVGGFSTVYQMIWRKHNGDEMHIAAKRLNKPDKRELDILSTLDHQNIVKLLGVVDEGINFLLILELCDGGSLREFLNNNQDNPLHWKKFYVWAEQAALPIEYLKKQGLVHKDIKSPNYLISKDTLKLADFGLAKKLEITISQATQTASFPWMAPELYKHSTLSPSYDIFALAVVIWELWTRLSPWKGLEPQVVAWRLCAENERLPIPSDMPQQLTDRIKQCWEADWHRRPTIQIVLSTVRIISETCVKYHMIISISRSQPTLMDNCC